MQDIFASALSPVDLWVFPMPNLSRWFAKLDWYLNWQMCTGLAYSGLHLPGELYRLAEAFEQTVDQFECRSSPLLVAPEGRLPAKRCLVLEGAQSLETWLAQVRDFAVRLKAQDARIFLPTHASPEAARTAWPATHGMVTHFVPDLEAIL